MELPPRERAVLDDRRVALARGDRGVGLRLVRVREPVRLAAGLDGRPADARHTLAVQADRTPRDDAEPCDATVLLALVERELQPEADHVRRGAEAFHRRARGADARQDREIRAGKIVGQVGAEAAQRELDRAHVAGAVARDRDVHRIPFVEGINEPSGRSAARSARPTALNAASAT